MNQNLLLTTDRGEFVLRVYGVKTERETRFERFMLNTLAHQQFPCPAPLTTINGKDVVTIEGKPAILYRCLPGHAPRELTPNRMEAIGKLQSQIHQTFAKKTAPIKKAGWEPGDIKQLIPRWRTKMIRGGFPNASAFLNFIHDELDEIRFPKSLPRGFTHQDIKPENILEKNNKISGILDFDNSYFGALLHDLTTTIIWCCFSKNKFDLRLVNAFIKGYETQRRLTADEKRLLLTDGLRFRLLREMFIGPITTLHNIPLATKRAGYFFKLYQNLVETK